MKLCERYQQQHFVNKLCIHFMTVFIGFALGVLGAFSVIYFLNCMEELNFILTAMLTASNIYCFFSNILPTSKNRIGEIEL